MEVRVNAASIESKRRVGLFIGVFGRLGET